MVENLVIAYQRGERSVAKLELRWSTQMQTWQSITNKDLLLVVLWLILLFTRLSGLNF